LALTGKALRGATRNNDIIARYGGDEFAIILPATDAAGAEQVAKRIHDLLKRSTLVGPRGALALRGSVGVAPLLPPDFPPPGDLRTIPTAYFQQVAQGLVRQADEALYRAKREGKHRCCTALATRFTPVEEMEPPKSSRPG
jgi:diguanylate cyclase (GGDEF)-like protein